MAYNSDPNAKRAFGLSMPTKLLTCLLSGTPMVVFAPDDSAVAKIVLQDACGLYLSPRNSAEDSARKLAAFVKDPSARECLARRGFEVSRRFSANTVRPAFQDAIISAGNSKEGLLK